MTEKELVQIYKTLCTKLKKENAELKTSVENLNKSVQELENKLTEKVTLESLDVVSAKINGLENNLTKAKEIIKKLIEAIHIWDCKNLEQVEAEAEQFLKDSEVEK